MIKIPKTEHQVMKFIWSQKSSKISSKEIGNYMLEQFDWMKPTTAKVLSRLVEKQFLQPKKEGRNITYTVLVEEHEYVKFETEEFFNFVHNKSLTSIVSALGEGDSISDEDIKELEEWINNR